MREMITACGTSTGAFHTDLVLHLDLVILKKHERLNMHINSKKCYCIKILFLLSACHTLQLTAAT